MNSMGTEWVAKTPIRRRISRSLVTILALGLFQFMGGVPSFALLAQPTQKSADALAGTASCQSDITSSAYTTSTADGDCIVTFNGGATGSTTSHTWVAPASVQDITFLLVAGGGSGGTGAGYSNEAGGGGAGGLILKRTTITPGTSYSLTVGGGGAGNSTGGTNGVNSTAFGFTALGGGHGGGANGGNVSEATSGGSGGGGAHNMRAGGAGNQRSSYTYGRGFDGATPGLGSSGAGGGGAGGKGLASFSDTAGTHGGNGGAGFLSYISGTGVWYAGGGAGSSNGTYPSLYGTGGSNVGGNGDGSAGAANTGSGGGGKLSNSGAAGGDGAAGILIIRWTPTGYTNSLRMYVKSQAGATSATTFTDAGKFYTSCSNTEETFPYIGEVSAAHNWLDDSAGGGPIGCGAETFTVYATGWIKAPAASFKIYTKSDDGSRVDINGTTYVNYTVDQGPIIRPDTGTSVTSSQISGLTAGSWYKIDTWMHENAGGAAHELIWSTDGGITQVSIPSSSLTYRFPSTIQTFSITNLTTRGVATTLTAALDTTTAKIYNDAGTAILARSGSFTFTDSGTSPSTCAAFAINSNGATTCSWAPNLQGARSLSLAFSSNDTLGINASQLFYASTYSTQSSVTQLSVTVVTAPGGDTDTALTFNGSTQYAFAPDADVFDITGAITMEAWVKPTAFPAVGSHGMVAQKSGAYELMMTNDAGVVTWKYGLWGASAWNGVSSNIPVVLNEWHHIAFTRGAGSNTVNFYYDGVLVRSDGGADTVSTGNIANSTYPFAIGVRYTNGNPSGDTFTGTIDQVAVFNTARSQTNVQSDMNSYIDTATSGLVAYYDFNEGSGSKLYNRLSTSNSQTDLSIIASPTWSDVKTVDSTTLPAYTIVKFPRSYISASGGWRAPANVSKATVVVVAGGGGGGSRHAGGGGGGGIAYAPTLTISSGSVYQVQVGGGGIGYGQNGNGNYNATSAGSNANGTGLSGANSHFKLTSTPESLTALGGGGGGGAGVAGGSGGGTNQTGSAGGTSTQYSTSYFTGFGNSGAAGYNGTACGTDWCGGGGGGAGTPGFTPVTTSGASHAGYGGDGKGFLILSDTFTYFAGGGGGGAFNATTAATGGNGGGGNGGLNSEGLSATYNTGSGGGGGGFNGGTSYRGGNGATGIVIIRWITALKPTFTPPVIDYLDVGQTETFTVNVASDSATVNLIRTFRWESSTTGVNGTFTKIKEGTGAANAYFSWIPTDTSTSGDNFVYRVIVTDSDTAGLFITDSATAYAIINRAMVLTPASGSTTIAKTINVSRDEPFTITLGTPTYSASMSPVIAGITLETTTATSLNLKIGETVTVGTYYETITVVDSVAATIKVPLTLIVAAPPNLLNTGEIVSDGLVLNLDAGSSASIMASDSTTITNINVRDISGSGKDAQVSGPFEGQTCSAPTYSNDFGGVLKFNGTNQCAYVPYMGTSFNKSYSIETWVKMPNGFKAGSSIFTQNDSSTTSDINFVLGASSTGSTNMRFQYRYGASTPVWQFSNVISVNVNSWMHIVGTYDGSNLRVYINGINVDTVTSTNGLSGSSYANTKGYFIGVGWDTGNKYFEGSIGAIRMYSRALTSANVSQNFNSTRTRFDSSNLDIVRPTYKYGNSLSESFTATSGYGVTAITPTVGGKQGLTWDLSVPTRVTFNAGQDLSSGYSYDTITATDALGASSYLPIRVNVTKADTLTIYLDTNTVITYNGAAATVLPTIQYSGLAGVDSFSTRRLFSSATYSETATVPMNADTYTVRAETATFSVGDATNYINVVYETRTLTINKAKQSPLNIFLYGGTVGSGFAIQLMGGNGDGVVTETLTGIASLTGCSISNHFLYASEQKQGYCEVRVVKATSQNYLSESSTVQMYFMAFVNSQPTGLVGSGATIAINGSTALNIDTTAPPRITSISWVNGYSTVDMELGQRIFVEAHWEISGSGFGAAQNTTTSVKFWRNKVSAAGAPNSGLYVESDSKISFTTLPSGVTPGRIVVMTPNGEAVSPFIFTP